ncbi:phenylacetaldoxime dehydratase family protein [Mycobacterium sp. smrl_JER01]|uniref:phenylacetaldoxime dehydratase family protein n=1 Tax=Mycobacterium sp. smrl_JER01 TaxID=3402633 RepID=UPI003AD5680B
MTWSNISYPRLLPARKPDGHQPRAPRWTLVYTEPITLITSDYLAIQVESWESVGVQAFLERLRVSHDDPEEFAPEAWELLTCTDDAGLLNIIHLAYWRDPTHHEQWLMSSALGRWYDGLDAGSIAFGAWHEVAQVPLDHAETIYSDPRGRFGLAACLGTQVEPMTVNGYFGAARDRLPVSAIDPLEVAQPQRSPSTYRETRGRRLRAESHHNMAIIRSGQFWATAGAEQLADYEHSLEPKLSAGMRHLSDHKEATGTLALRVMTSLDRETLQPRRETSTYAHFQSLTDLEAWAENHPTHHAIYEHAIAKNREYGADREVTTWHEVFIQPSSARAEYVNCDPTTGLLPSARNVLAVE